MIAAGQAADSEATRIVAETVRSQGLPCAETISADPDPAASRPDEAVWILVCGDARYRVRFMGDSEAKIERLE